MNAPLSRVSVLALVALAPLGGTAQAQSACVPAAPSDGASVTCSGAGTGIVDDSLDELTVTVDASGAVTDDGAQAFAVDDDLVLTNAGSITSTEDHAIEADNDATITNSGQITGDGDGIQLSDDALVTNSGTITGGNRGVDIAEDGTVLNLAGGTITGSSSDAIRIEDDGVVENAGTITGDDEGIQVDDEADITNSGIITGADRGIDVGGTGIVVNAAAGEVHGTDSDGIRVEGSMADVTNHGLVTGGDEAIQVGDDATVRNHGTLRAVDKGIAAEDDATILNTGLIETSDEGIEAGDDAEIDNSGQILTVDDAINAGERASIVNSGLLSASGAQDGIDIDSGTVLNTGTIVSTGGEDGIDFDYSEEAVSTITNHGRIEGHVGINVELGGGEDPANTVSQVVVNHGTIIGHGGLALQLGAGDDTLDLYSMDITGAVDLGEGTDTLIVRGGLRPGSIAFVSDPEVLDMDAAPESAAYGNGVLAVASPAVFGDMDAVTARQGLALGKAVLDVVPAAPQPATTRRAMAFAGPGGQGGWWGTGAIAEFDGDGSARLTLGRDLGAYGFFLSHGGTRTEAADGHDIDTRSTLLGLRAQHALSGGATLSGMAYAGFGETEMESGATVLGDGTADTRILGLAGALRSARTASGLGLAARAGIERRHLDAFTMSGLGGARFGDRDVTTGYLSAEASILVELSSITVEHFVGVDVIFADGDEVTMSLGGAPARFAPDGDETMSQLTLGAVLGGQGAPWSLRVSGQVDEDGATGAALTAGLRF